MVPDRTGSRTSACGSAASSSAPAQRVTKATASGLTAGGGTRMVRVERPLEPSGSGGFSLSGPSGLPRRARGPDSTSTQPLVPCLCRTLPRATIERRLHVPVFNHPMKKRVIRAEEFEVLDAAGRVRATDRSVERRVSVLLDAGPRRPGSRSLRRSRRTAPQGSRSATRTARSARRSDSPPTARPASRSVTGTARSAPSSVWPRTRRPRSVLTSKGTR